MRKIVWLIYNLFFLIGGNVAATFDNNTIPNKLNKLFYHQSSLSDRIVCCFEKSPLCKQIAKNEKKDMNECGIEFFLPQTYLASSEARQMMQTVNQIKRNHYSIQFSEETKPAQGIKVSIKYNPQKVACDYALCDTISMQKGLVFNFHNKDVLNLLNQNTSSILHQASNIQKSKPRVMLDFGHGGSDAGKIGFFNLKEKDINWHVGEKLAHLLREKGYQVLCTRNSDIHVPLDVRTTTANNLNADIFVSIHSNSGPERASGIETFWTERNALKRNILKAENTISLTHFLQPLDNASKLLASQIQKHVVERVAGYNVKDRTTKQSLAQVLFGTDMPSALIELGFLSNRLEAKRLANAGYQLLLAQGICNGIEAYCKTSQLI
ncbi:MAG: N-acetylmuramoyl-L-alanine amidase [Candidatus Babeliales bacterium]